MYGLYTLYNQKPINKHVSSFKRLKQINKSKITLKIMNKFDARTFLQLKKNSKLFFSLAVIAGSMQQVNASSATLSGYAHVSKAKELVA